MKECKIMSYNRFEQRHNNSRVVIWGAQKSYKKVFPKYVCFCCWAFFLFFTWNGGGGGGSKWHLAPSGSISSPVVMTLLKRVPKSNLFTTHNSHMNFFIHFQINHSNLWAVVPLRLSTTGVWVGAELWEEVRWLFEGARTGELGSNPRSSESSSQPDWEGRDKTNSSNVHDQINNLLDYGI